MLYFLSFVLKISESELKDVLNLKKYPNKEIVGKDNALNIDLYEALKIEGDNLIDYKKNISLEM